MLEGPSSASPCDVWIRLARFRAAPVPLASQCGIRKAEDAGWWLRTPEALGVCTLDQELTQTERNSGDRR
jgi:hypothetical protein